MLEKFWIIIGKKNIGLDRNNNCSVIENANGPKPKCLWLDSNPEALSSYSTILPNGWVFVYDLSGCGFESSCSHLTFRFGGCFE